MIFFSLINYSKPIFKISAFQAPPGSQGSSRGEAKDSALLSSRDRYADDTSLMAENKEELNSFVMKVKEE